MKHADVLGISLLLVMGGVCAWSLADAARAARAEAHCMTNLRRIGQAMAMYRADYDAVIEPQPGLSPDELGFPPRLRALQPYGIRPPMLGCFSYQTGMPAAYGYQFWTLRVIQKSLEHSELQRVLDLRQSQFPLVWDANHMSPRERFIGPANWLVLRLDGSATKVSRPVGSTMYL